MLKPLYSLFSWIMKFCLNLAGDSYLIALLFFALIMQIILLPLAIKQQKSQILMAKIKPKEMAIREKYKGRNDNVTRQKMTMEIQEMYQKNGYNQFGGCLPLLIQLPIIIILFNIVKAPISYASDVEKFETSNYEVAIEYYQDLKDSLDSEAFEGDEYSSYVASIETSQKAMGGKKVDDSNVYEYDSGVTKNNEELAITYLIIDGKDELESLISDGKITEDKIDYLREKYDETGLESYKDQMANYKIAGKNNLNLLNEPDMGPNILLMIIPVLVFLTSFLTTKLTRKLSGAATQTDANGNPVGGGFFMEVGMPLISAIFAYNFSAAIGAYWVWRTVIGMGQSLVLAKVMPIPAVTAEDIAEAKREMKSNQKKKKVITIEVDEDDSSYDDMIVAGKKSSDKSNDDDVINRTPRKIEMLTADDEDED